LLSPQVCGKRLEEHVFRIRSVWVGSRVPGTVRLVEAPGRVFIWFACAISGFLVTWLAVLLSLTGPGFDGGGEAGIAVGFGAFSLGALACLLGGRAINKGWLGYLAGVFTIALLVVFVPVALMTINALRG
jgi:hypothetical protein